MTNEDIINQVAAVVEAKLSGEGTGHDWWHIYRVWQMAKHIGEKEEADLFIIELAALLHDIADWKFHEGDENIGPRVTREILEKYKVQHATIDHVCLIIEESGFKGQHKIPSTLEGKIMQDADRLDALGAIGIARTFAYGGHKGHMIYEPSIKPATYTRKQDYANTKSPTVNHFYEKLLLLKDLMNTHTAKKIADERHQYMEEFLERFYKEWNGK